MATKLKEVDVVLVGFGWSGGILAKELTEAGMKVVALERGAIRRPEDDFAVPRIRDELRYSGRHDLMQDPAVDTLTIRNNVKQVALPMRRLGSFLPGQGAGGAGGRRRRERPAAPGIAPGSHRNRAGIALGSLPHAAGSGLECAGPCEPTPLPRGVVISDAGRVLAREDWMYCLTRIKQ